MASALRTKLDMTVLAALVLITALPLASSQQYFGKRIGSLSRTQHDVKGEVYAVDSRTIHIKGFSYDGTAPDAFFYAGKSGLPSDDGFIIPDENGSTKPLGHYNNKDVTLTLPEGVTLKNVKWLSIWCRAFGIDFGQLVMPQSLQYPRPQKINGLSTLDHGVKSDRIVVVDAQTFLIPNFHYDGSAPDAHFWVGRGNKVNPDGTIVPDENGSTKPLKRYDGKTIVITLPDHLTIFDIDFLSVWCKAFFANFGNVRIPSNLNVPPSLKMLGVAPQTKLNCEVLYDGLALEVRWAVAGESIVMQLVGRVADGEYMSFGLSGSETRSSMVGGDVVTAWLERDTGRGFAQDYNLQAKAQCQGGRGSCPDAENQGSNDVRLLNAALINDFTMLTFQRPLTATEFDDKPIHTNASQAVIWAVGPVNSQGHTSYHTLRSTGDMFVDFGRTPRWNCPLPDDQQQTPSGSQQPKQNRQQPSSIGGSSAVGSPQPSPSAWFIPPIPCHEPEDGVFYAQIGPTGGENGYNAITGHVGWGIAYYINGLLIPEIHVVRGKTYTFVVEGGHDPANPSRSHPLYITDDPEGGYEFKTPAERSQVKVFAGVSSDTSNTPAPSAFGRLCEWKQSPGQPSGDFNSFGAYQRSLTLDCQEGQPGILQWTPDANTPDTVYYQCYTHRFLGWKIHVHDTCDSPQQRNNAPDYDYYYYDDQRGQGSTHKKDVTVGAYDPTTFESKKQRSGENRKSDVTKDHRDRHHRFNHNKQENHKDKTIKAREEPIGFESFPFDLNKDRSQFNQNGNKNVKLPPNAVSDYNFPSLSSIRKSSNTVNASAIEKFRNEASSEYDSNFYGPRPGDLDFPTETKFLKSSESHSDIMQQDKLFENFGNERDSPKPEYVITNQYNYLDVSNTLNSKSTPPPLSKSDHTRNFGSTSSFSVGHHGDAFNSHRESSHENSLYPTEEEKYRRPFQSDIKNYDNPKSPEIIQGVNMAIKTNNAPRQRDKHYTPDDRDIHTPVPVKIETSKDFMKHDRPNFVRQKPVHHHNLYSSIHSSSGAKYIGFKPETVVFEDDFSPILTPDSPGPPHMLGIKINGISKSSGLSNEVRKRESSFFRHPHVSDVINTVDFEENNMDITSHFKHQFDMPNEHKHQMPFSNNKPHRHIPSQNIGIRGPLNHNIRNPSFPRTIENSEFIISGSAGKPHPLNNPNILSNTTFVHPKHHSIIEPNIGRPQSRFPQEMIVNPARFREISMPSHPNSVRIISPGSQTGLSTHFRAQELPNQSPAHSSPQLIHQELHNINPGFGIPTQNNHLIIPNNGNSNVDLSTHFKSPHDPRHSFGVHNLPPGSNNRLFPGNPQLVSLHPMSNIQMAGSMPIRSGVPPHPPRILPPGATIGAGPGIRKRRPLSPQHHGKRRRVHHSHQGVRNNPHRRNVAISDHTRQPPQTVTSGKMSTSSNRVGNSQKSGEKSDSRPHNKSAPPRRDSSTASAKSEGFLASIWATLTGANSDGDTRLNSRNNAPRPKPRMNQ